MSDFFQSFHCCFQICILISELHCFFHEKSLQCCNKLRVYNFYFRLWKFLFHFFFGSNCRLHGTAEILGKAYTENRQSFFHHRKEGVYIILYRGHGCLWIAVGIICHLLIKFCNSIYSLLDIDRGVPEVWGSTYDVRDLVNASVALRDGRKITDMDLGIVEKLALKELLKKVRGTDVEKLLVEHGAI